MQRIFLTLAAIASVILILATVWGLDIGDAKSLDPEVQKSIGTHMLIGMGALTFTILVHAISLTYFMGTGRWIEETCRAYSLPEDYLKQSQKNKYQTLPGMTLCIVLLVTTGALGAVADPGTAVSLDGFLGLTSAGVHFATAVVTALINVAVYLSEYFAIARNGSIVHAILADVQRIRTERGLPT